MFEFNFKYHQCSIFELNSLKLDLNLVETYLNNPNLITLNNQTIKIGLCQLNNVTLFVKCESWHQNCTNCNSKENISILFLFHSHKDAAKVILTKEKNGNFIHNVNGATAHVELQNC